MQDKHPHMPDDGGYWVVSHEMVFVAWILIADPRATYID